jgi:predicted MFS family arabinose efflux permease
VFSTAYKRYVLGVMAAVYLFNLVDRGLMMLLLEPIKEDLGLSDTQLGFLTGIAFALFYATLGLPMARWADRGNRVTIASLAVALWAVTVMSCMLVTNYAQLVLARIAAAVGESGSNPPTYSLVGDYFPEAGERSRALSVYVSGSTLSALLSFMLGGWLNEQYGWRMTFFLLGIPGLLLAILVKLTVREPRVNVHAVTKSIKPAPFFRDVLSLLWNQRSCRHLSIALIVLYMMSLGLSPWYAAFLMRSHGMGTAELGIWLGLIVGVGGTAGILLGGYGASRFYAHDERGQLRAIAFGIASLVPCLAAFLLLPHKHQALMALVPIAVAFNFFFGPVFALLQRLVPEDMRATTLAVVMLFANLIGMGLGPQIVGILSDVLRPSLGADALRYSMLMVSGVAFWGAVHFWKTGETIRADLEA